MRTIFKIAWLELKTLFSSPIAWFLLIIFTVQTSLDFIELLKSSIVSQLQGFIRLGGSGNLIGSYVTEFIYGLSGGMTVGIFKRVIDHWYLYVPLLSMGLISRELSSGNIKLLFSSPVKVREIVLGKFAGIMLYWTLLMLVLLVLVLCGCLFITNLDLPLIWSCLLGVYLLAMLYSAIGLFVSCLTQYQIVAAISTLIVLGVLDYFGGLWQGRPFLRDVTWFINTPAHTENLLMGLIVSRDLIYFLMLTIMFLLLSIMTLQNMVYFRPMVMKVVRYVGLVVVVLLIGYVASRPQWTWYNDVTAFKTNTLTPASQEVLKQLKGPVQITIMDNLFEKEGIGRPESVNPNIRFWEPYKRFLPELKIDYVHFYDSIGGSYSGAPDISIDSAAKAVAREKKLDLNTYLKPEQIHKLVDLTPYDHKTVIRIRNNGKEVFLRRHRMGGENEEYFIANFKRMIYGPDTLAYLTGNGERSIENDGATDYKSRLDHESTFSLNESGFEAITHNPEQPIPKSVNTLIIADPLNPYSEQSLKHIQDYISSGGNALILKGVNDGRILEPLVKPMGIEFLPGQVVQPNKRNSANHIRVNLNRAALSDTTYIIEDWNTVRLHNVTALKYQQNGSFKIEPVLTTDAKSTWNKRLESTLDTGKLDFHPEQGDNHSQQTVAVALTRQINGKEQRIMVAGSAEFPSRGGDVYFLRTVSRWFAYGKYPLDMLRRDPVLNKVELSYKQSDLLKYVLVLLIPGLLILFGSVYLLKRRSL